MPLLPEASQEQEVIVTLSGANHYLLKSRLDQVVGDFVKQHGDLSLERIEAPEAEPQAILEAVSALPFLTQRKMVVLRSLSQNKPAAESIEQIISSINNDVDTIFYEPITDKRTVFYKMLKSKTQLEEFNELAPQDLAKWLVEEAKNQAGQLSLTYANYLVERVGNNQALVASELAKLVTYDPKVTRETIDLLTQKTPQSRVFDLMDAAFNGQKAKALSLYAEQRAQKVEPQAILAMLAWQLQLIALAKAAGARSSGEVAKEAGINPYPVAKAQTLARQLTPEKLEDMVNQALKIDRLSKTKPIDLDEALKTYIAAL